MKIEKKTVIYTLLSIAGIFLFIYYWNTVEGFIIKFLSAASPILIGCAVAYIINILMNFYEIRYFPKKSHRLWVKRTRRPVCLTAAILTLLGIIALIIRLVIPELVSCIKLLIAEIPPVIEKLLKNEMITKVIPETVISSLSSINWQDYISKIVGMLTSSIGTAAGTIFSAVTSLVSSTITLFISLIFSIYLLFSKETLLSQGKRIMKNYLPSKATEKVQYVLSVINDSFHGYIVGQCTEAVILGVLCIIGMFIFRFPYAMMIGTLIGFTALIPIAGAFIGAGVGAIMILTVSPVKSLLFILFIIILQQLEENLIYPKVVGGKLGLPAVFVLAAITVGGSLMGILGMLIAVPITSAIYKLIRDDVRKGEAKTAKPSPSAEGKRQI